MFVSTHQYAGDKHSERNVNNRFSSSSIIWNYSQSLLRWAWTVERRKGRRIQIDERELEMKLKYNSRAPHNFVPGLERKSCVHEALEKLFTSVPLLVVHTESQILLSVRPQRKMFNGLFVCSFLPFEWNGRYKMIDSSQRKRSKREEELHNFLLTFNYDSTMRENFLLLRLSGFFSFVLFCFDFFVVRRVSVLLGFDWFLGILWWNL